MTELCVCRETRGCQGHQTGLLQLRVFNRRGAARGTAATRLPTPLQGRKHEDIPGTVSILSLSAHFPELLAIRPMLCATLGR